MTGFLANITDLTRLEGGQISPRLGPVALDEVVDSASARVPRGLHVAVQMPEPAPVVMADAALLEQALVNVLENAREILAGRQPGARARDGGGRRGVQSPSPTRGWGSRGTICRMCSTVFFRAERGDRIAPGTGLGLAIARGMVEAMAGRIEAQSPRPEMPADGLPGTVVSIRLPLFHGVLP